MTIQHERRDLTVDGTRLSYRVIGDGPTTVLLVHGWMVDGRVYDPLLGALDHKGCRFIVPDLRGAGSSDKPASGYSLARFAADVQAILEHEARGPAVVVGHSMGGQIAQLVASAVPAKVAGLALLCTVPAEGMALPPDAAGLFRTSGGDRGKQATILGLACKDLSTADRDALLDGAGAIPPSCIAEVFEAWSGGAGADRLGAIAAPTLVVASDDPFLPPDFLRAKVVDPIARARLVVVPGAGHYVQVERARETAAVLGAFLAGLGA
ncbi:MAG: alpha/beta hydrolase [Minicystis sp.]